MDNSNPESSEFQFKYPTFIPTKSKKKSLNDTKGNKETVIKAMHTPILESNNTVQNIPKLALSSRKHVKINETYKFDQNSDLCTVSSIVSTKESVKMFDNFKIGENHFDQPQLLNFDADFAELSIYSQNYRDKYNSTFIFGN